MFQPLKFIAANSPSNVGRKPVTLQLVRPIFAPTSTTVCVITDNVDGVQS